MSNSRVRFLVDNALSPKVAELLREAGHEAVHVRAYGLQAAPDDVVLARAAQEDRILVSADADFATLLALGALTKPSLVLFRLSVYRPESQVKLLLANLPSFAHDLERGCVVVLEDQRIRLRPLPL